MIIPNIWETKKCSKPPTSFQRWENLHRKPWIFWWKMTIFYNVCPWSTNPWTYEFHRLGDTEGISLHKRPRVQELRKLVPSGEMFTRIAIKEAPNIAGLFIMKTTRLYRVIAISQLSHPIVCNESTNDPFDDWPFESVDFPVHKLS